MIRGLYSRIALGLKIRKKPKLGTQIKTMTNLAVRAGGQYTSIKDLKTWALAILKSTELPEVLTRRWFTHAASTAVWTSNVGVSSHLTIHNKLCSQLTLNKTPFEIYRLPIVVDSDYNLSRIVNIYSKSGDVGQYSTSFALIPDYDLAWGVLSAGVTPNTQASAVRDIIASNFVSLLTSKIFSKDLAKPEITDQRRRSRRKSPSQNHLPRILQSQ